MTQLPGSKKAKWDAFDNTDLGKKARPFVVKGPAFLNKPLNAYIWEGKPKWSSLANVLL